MTGLLMATLICTGVAPTTPKTNIEVEVRNPDRISTIRYEIAEGSLSGTAYVQSIGYMERSHVGSVLIFKSGNGPNSTKLSLRLRGDTITDSRLSHYISGMKDARVECAFEE